MCIRDSFKIVHTFPANTVSCTFEISEVEIKFTVRLKGLFNGYSQLSDPCTKCSAFKNV